MGLRVKSTPEIRFHTKTPRGANEREPNSASGLHIRRTSDLCTTASDHRTRGRLRPPPPASPRTSRPAGFGAPVERRAEPPRPLPRPPGARDPASPTAAAGGRADVGGPQAPRPAPPALTSHADGLQHRPAEARRWAPRTRGATARASETRSRGRWLWRPGAG